MAVLLTLGSLGTQGRCSLGRARKSWYKAAGESAGSFHLQRPWGSNEKSGVFQESRMKPGMEKCLYTLSDSAVFIRMISEPQVGVLCGLPRTAKLPKDFLSVWRHVRLW